MNSPVNVIVPSVAEDLNGWEVQIFAPLAIASSRPIVHGAYHNRLLIISKVSVNINQKSLVARTEQVVNDEKPADLQVEVIVVIFRTDQIGEIVGGLSIDKLGVEVDLPALAFDHVRRFVELHR